MTADLLGLQICADSVWKTYARAVVRGQRPLADTGPRPVGIRCEPGTSSVLVSSCRAAAGCCRRGSRCRWASRFQCDSTRSNWSPPLRSAGSRSGGLDSRNPTVSGRTTAARGRGRWSVSPRGAVGRTEPRDVVLQAVRRTECLDSVERLAEFLVREQRVDLSSSASAGCGCRRGRGSTAWRWGWWHSVAVGLVARSSERRWWFWMACGSRTPPSRRRQRSCSTAPWCARKIVKIPRKQTGFKI